MTAGDVVCLICCAILGAALGFFVPFPYGMIAGALIGFVWGNWQGRRSARIVK